MHRRRPASVWACQSSWWQDLHIALVRCMRQQFTITLSLTKQYEPAEGGNGLSLTKGIA